MVNNFTGTDSFRRDSLRKVLFFGAGLLWSSWLVGGCHSLILIFRRNCVLAPLLKVLSQTLSCTSHTDSLLPKEFPLSWVSQQPRNKARVETLFASSNSSYFSGSGQNRHRRKECSCPAPESRYHFAWIKIAVRMKKVTTSDVDFAHSAWKKSSGLSDLASSPQLRKSVFFSSLVLGCWYPFTHSYWRMRFSNSLTTGMELGFLQTLSPKSKEKRQKAYLSILHSSMKEEKKGKQRQPRTRYNKVVCERVTQKER